jgi:DNA ligase (NAD+)
MFEDIAEFLGGRIADLEKWISEARQAYYNGTPIATDEVYDARVDELAELKEDSPAVTAIGAPPPASFWPKVEHRIPMGSLDKVQTMDEMSGWVNKVARKFPYKKEELIVTEKLDGISVSMQYEEGRLIQALTRGDGTMGEDITQNVVRMKGVPKVLPEPISVIFRGEIVLLKEDHQKHFPDKANPRNTASGTAKRLDGKGCEHLTVIVYQALEGPEFQTEVDQFKFLEQMRLHVPRWYPSALAPGVRTPHDLWVEYQQTIREQLPYDIDGLVIRLNDLAYQWSLGDRNGRPYGAVAFKFAPVSRETVAIGREDQVGGTGRITPVAVFKPVRLLGAEVSRASLYNQTYIENIGFDVGARILVSRANDVIPRVVSVTGSTGTVSQPPEKCPQCGAKTVRVGEYLTCPNTSECPTQTVGRLLQWVKELGILEWGESLVQKLVNEGLVRSVPDLYRLTREQLASLDRMGETSADNVLRTLWAVVPLPLESFLGALGIPLCATATIQLVVDAGYDTLEKILGASVAQLQGIAGMGPRRAQSLTSWLERNRELLQDLLGSGVQIKDRPVGSLTGKSVCFTGKSTRKRSELEAFAKEAGASVKKSVTKDLTYLVLADPNSTSTKVKAARKNGTECISEEAFLGMVGATNG